MAKLYITEHYAGAHAGAQIVKWPPRVSQPPVAIGALPVQSLPFSGDAKIVRIHCDTACSIAFGDNPEATVDDARMAANQTEYFDVNVGQKLSVIANT